MAKASKKYLEALKLVDSTKRYSIAEAVELVKQTSYTKFDGTFKIAFRLNLDPRKARQKIKGGWYEFDIIVATPDMMGELGKLGKILGPKGLMPNAKTGTVTMDVQKAVEEIKAGKVEYRVDKHGNIQVIVGKVSFDNIKLVENIQTIYNTIVRIKPSTVKGVYVQNVAISATMSPGIKVNPEA